MEKDMLEKVNEFLKKNGSQELCLNDLEKASGGLNETIHG